MRAVIDTCVIVDALQSREPFCKEHSRFSCSAQTGSLKVS